jgi:hypothetical protein
MKNSRCILIASLFWIVILGHLSTTAAQTAYIDPVNGDNRNPGLSPATAKKSGAGIITGSDDYATNLLEAMQSVPSLSGEAPDAAIAGTAEMMRIILGSEIGPWKASQ